ncbi:MAG: hypothetical protein AAGI52_13340 [Bacteroidota bacterium]
MRTLPLLLAALVALPASAQDWTTVPVGTPNTLRQFEIASFSNLHLVGDGGVVVIGLPPYTTWTPEPIGTSENLTGILRPTATQIWIAGDNGVVRVRDTQGNWLNRNIPTAETLVLSSRASGEAIAYGSGGGIWYSDDLGATWVPQTSGTSATLRNAIGGTGPTGVAVGDGGIILRTTDQGATWTPIPSGTTADLYDIAYIGSGMGVVGADGTILRSFDDGLSWTPEVSPVPVTLRALDTSGANVFFHLAVGDSGTVLTSRDNGDTWCVLPTGSTEDFWTAEMVTNSLFLVAGTNGTLLKTESGGGGCTPVATETLPRAEIALSAVWPNPVRTEATLTLRLDAPRDLRVTILDARGREIRVIHEGTLPSSAAVPLALDVSGLTPAPYTVRVEGDGVRDSRPFVVVR